jgi:DNA-binding transcriptional regulator YiaG
MRNYAKEWKSWRLAHNMSQGMMARAIGLSLRTVKGIELKEHIPAYTSRQRFMLLKHRYERENICPNCSARLNR